MLRYSFCLCWPLSRRIMCTSTGSSYILGLLGVCGGVCEEGEGVHARALWQDGAQQPACLSCGENN